jgi:hypothetical protein
LMREAGVPSTWEDELYRCDTKRVVPTPPGIVMVAPPEISRNALRAQCEGRAKEGFPKSAARDSIKAGIIHLASLQRGSLILREDCYNVVT